MDLSNVMGAFGMIASLKDKLVRYGVSPKDLANVNFNNPEEVNELAKKVMPGILKNNKQLADGIKQMASMLGNEKAKEVCEVIDMG